MEKTWLELFFQKSPLPLAFLKVEKDGQGNPRDYLFMEANPLFNHLLAKESGSCVGSSFFDYFPKQNIKGEEWSRKIRQSFETQSPVEITVDTLIPGKKLQIRLFPLGGEIWGCILRDITQEQSWHDQVDGFLDISVDMFAMLDDQGDFLRLNRRFEEVLGYGIPELTGKNIFSLIVEEDWEPTREAMKKLRNHVGIFNFVNRYRCKDGSVKSLEWRASPQGDFIYASARDVTETVKKEEALKTAAIIDPLTGLYNRNFFYGRVYEEISRSEADLSPLSMIAIDIDHFKFVNDIWGHPVGDEILERTGRLLKTSLRATDVLCRIGGEEFVVLLKNTGLDGAMVVANKMHGVLNQNPHPRVGKVTASFGVAERHPKEEFNQWYKRADDAVYVSKENGRNTISVAGIIGETAAPSIYLTWKETWDSGNAAIDSQHRELIEMGNHLTFLTVSAADPAQISSQIDQLLSHVGNHFSTEEKILRDSGYPGIEEHHKIHTGLLRTAKRTVDDFRTKKTQTPIALSFLITDLIVGHMENEDSKFFPFVRPR